MCYLELSRNNFRKFNSNNDGILTLLPEMLGSSSATLSHGGKNSVVEEIQHSSQALSRVCGIQSPALGPPHQMAQGIRAQINLRLSLVLAMNSLSCVCLQET